MTLTIGSLCTGYGGLDMAVRDVLDAEVAWHADNDPGASTILAHHWPTVPNLGDIKTVDWATVTPVDIVTGGYPCQPFSVAGKRKGTADERHLWPHIAVALGVLRPRLAVFENVANHLRLGFDTVLADLARLGFDAEWCRVRASEVGAPHRRDRLFVLAWPADAEGEGQPRQGLRGRLAERRAATADATRLGRERSRPTRNRRPRPENGGLPPSVTDRGGLAGHEEPSAGRNALQQRLRPDADRCDDHWGVYGPAIHRWARILGRPAPRAVDDRGRLSPEFVEWLMGPDEAHVTGVPGLTRAQQLHALGNGVVPAQAAAAIRLLLDRACLEVAS